MSCEYLVVLDIGSIHDYLFGTNKLREIRGASILLDKLNRKLPNHGNEDTDWKSIVVGGGNVRVLFRDETKAKDYKRDLTNIFKEKVTGVKFTAFISERKGEDDEEWLKRVERELQRKKSLHEERNHIVTSSFFKACQACGLYPAEEEDRHAGESHFICKSCNHKVEESKDYEKTEIYKRLVKELGFQPKFPSDFSEIGEESEPKGYIGFIYADANRMGEHLARITTFNEPFNELKKFSEDVEKATLEATVITIAEYFKKKKEKLPLQIILAGGDDLILTLPADRAINVAIDFCAKFNNKLSSRGITTSASIVICHDTLPIKNVLNAAESLLKNAKAESRNNGCGSYIDFAVVKGAALENPISKRKKELEYGDMGTHSVTKRPYSISEMEKVVGTIRAFKKDVPFPNNKLAALYESLFKGHFQSILDSCYLKMRLEVAQKEKMDKLIEEFNLRWFPWEEIGPMKYATPLGDIIELYQFIN